MAHCGVFAALVISLVARCAFSQWLRPFGVTTWYSYSPSAGNSVYNFFNEFHQCITLNQSAILPVFSSQSDMTYVIQNFGNNVNTWVGGFSYYTSTNRAIGYWPMSNQNYSGTSPAPPNPTTRCIALMWNGTANPPNVQWITPPQTNPASKLSCMQRLTPLCRNDVEFIMIMGSYTFFEAYQQCAATGAQLAEIADYSVTDVLQKIFLPNETIYFWMSFFNPGKVTGEIGINASSNPFYYMDGTQLSADLLVTAGIGNLQKGACSTLQAYSQSSTTAGMLVMDTTKICNLALNVLCQAAPSNGKCASGWLLVNSLCFIYYNSESLSLYQAMKKCQTVNGVLPMLQDQNMVSSVLTRLSARTFWLGGFTYGSSGRSNVVSTSPDKAPSLITSGASPALPATWVSSRCIALKYTCIRPCTPSVSWTAPPLLSGSPSSLSCLQPLAYVCQNTSGPACSAGWRLINSKCYLINTTGVSWLQAAVNCYSRGANLLTGEAAESVLTSLMQSNLTYWNGTYFFWTALINNGLANEFTSAYNSFYWNDGTALSLQLYKYFDQATNGVLNVTTGACAALYLAPSVIAVNWTVDSSAQSCVSPRAVGALCRDTSLGPVTDTTRGIYLKKLGDLRRKQRESQARLLVTSQSASEAETDDERNTSLTGSRRGRSNRRSVAPQATTVSPAPTSARSRSSKQQVKAEPDSNRSTPERAAAHAAPVEPAFSAVLPQHNLDTRPSSATAPKAAAGASLNGSNSNASRLVEASSVENSDAESDADTPLRVPLVPTVNSGKFDTFKKPALVPRQPVNTSSSTNSAESHATAQPDSAFKSSAIHAARNDEAEARAQSTAPAPPPAPMPTYSFLPDAVRRFSPIRLFRPSQGGAELRQRPSAAAAHASSTPSDFNQSAGQSGYMLDCMDEEHAFRAHVFESVCLVYQRVLRFVLYAVICLALLFVLLLVVDAFRQRSAAQMFSDEFVTSGSVANAGAGSKWAYRYCEEYRLAPSRCLAPSAAQQLLRFAEHVAVDLAKPKRCAKRWFDVSDDPDLKPDRIEYADFFNSVKEHVKAVPPLQLDKAGEMLIVAFGGSHPESLFHVLNASGKAIEFSKKESAGVSYSEPDLASARFVELTDAVDSQLPFECRTRRIVNRVASLLFLTVKRLFVAISVLVVLCLSIYLFWFVRERKARRHAAEQERVYAFVERIFEYMQTHASRVITDAESESEDSAATEAKREAELWVPVPNVRDALIAPRQRDRKTIALWERTIDLLKAQESRVRFAIRRVDGEDFECMRLTAHELGRSDKVWQGRAFHPSETKQNAKRKPSLDQPAATSTWKFSVFGRAPPTEVQAQSEAATPEASQHAKTKKRLPAEYRCLKVSQMFDPLLEEGDDWHVRIEDAVLEKCSELKSGFVNHVYVDKRSREGVVYAKLSNAEAAREARDALHGWWFGGRLLIAKYVSVNQYVERFSDARNSDTRRLQPSNAERRSLRTEPFSSVFENS